LAQARKERKVQSTIVAPVGQVLRPEIIGRKHWSISFATRRRCRVCSARGVNRKVSVKCLKVDVTHVWRENGFRLPHQGKSL